MSTKWLAVSLGLGFALFAGLARVESAPAAGEDAGVRQQCQAYVSSFNRHDAKGMAAVFAEDGDMITPMGQLVKGRAAIEASLAADHGPKGALREATLEVKEEPVRFVTSDVAVSDALVVVKGAYGPDGSKGDAMTLLVTNVWKKSGDRWWVFASRAHVKEAAPAH